MRKCLRTEYPTALNVAGILCYPADGQLTPGGKTAVNGSGTHPRSQRSQSVPHSTPGSCARLADTLNWVIARLSQTSAG